MSGNARFKFKHGIDSKDINDRRLVVTLRELTPEFKDDNNELGKQLREISSLFL